MESSQSRLAGTPTGRCPYVVGVPANHVFPAKNIKCYHPKGQLAFPTVPYYFQPMQFHTATINTWKHLLQDDSFKDIIINSLNWLHDNNRAITHGFVIMPNHIHLLWTTFETGKQHPAHALASHTAHEFKKRITGYPESGKLLNPYISTQADRDYHFWERRPKSVDIKDRNMAARTLEYIHNNPLQEHWRLAGFQEDYKYSSAGYYINGQSEFKFLKHVGEFL